MLVTMKVKAMYHKGSAIAAVHRYLVNHIINIKSLKCQGPSYENSKPFTVTVLHLTASFSSSQSHSRNFYIVRLP